MERKPTLQNSILAAFVHRLEDPRASNRSHPLETVIFSLLVGVLCGANGLVEVAHVAQKKRKFIERYVDCAHGTPTHDTIGRVLGMLDPEKLAEAFAFFMARVTDRSFNDVINIDGKTLRGLMNKFARNKKGANVDDQVHIVSAFSELRGYVLAQIRSNVMAEQAATQTLLRLLAINDSTITLDAAHNSIKTMQMIAERGAHVVVGVKANYESLLREAKSSFKKGKPIVFEHTEEAHGRVEHRKYTLVVASGEYTCGRLPMMKVFICTERRFESAGRAKPKPRKTYYATSLELKEAARIVDCIRRRWGIENKLHFVLDMTFDQDNCRVRTGYAAENFSRFFHLALNLLKADTTEKVSVQNKRFSAATDDTYLERLLGSPAAK